MENLGLNIATATAKGFTHQVLGQGLITDTEVTNENGHITIDAREGDDQIKVNQNGKMLSVYVNNKETISIDTSKAKSVTILGGKGQDKIEVDKKVTFPLTLKGNEHNDDIRATNPGHNNIYGGGGIDKIQAKPTDHVTYGDYMKVVGGQAFQGTVCIPISSAAELPPPPPSTPCPADPSVEELQKQWQQAVSEVSRQGSAQIGKEAARCSERQTKKLEDLLLAALNSGNIELAVLLMAGLESHQANEVAGGLIKRIQKRQEERNAIAQRMGSLNDKQGAEMSRLNTEVSGIATEISLLQTFLQDVMSQKNEAQNLASNFLKSRHDTAMGIIRNIG